MVLLTSVEDSKIEKISLIVIKLLRRFEKNHEIIIANNLSISNKAQRIREKSSFFVLLQVQVPLQNLSLDFAARPKDSLILILLIDLEQLIIDQGVFPVFDVASHYQTVVVIEHHIGQQFEGGGHSLEGGGHHDPHILHVVDIDLQLLPVGARIRAPVDVEGGQVHRLKTMNIQVKNTVYMILVVDQSKDVFVVVDGGEVEGGV